MFRIHYLLAGLVLTVLATGCGDERRKEEQIDVKTANDPLHAPRSILQRYAAGQPLGSEATSFPHMVEEVRKVDPNRAAILEKGLEEIQKAAPAARRGKAKELLAKLQPSMQ